MKGLSLPSQLITGQQEFFMVDGISFQFERSEIPISTGTFASWRIDLSK